MLIEVLRDNLPKVNQEYSLNLDNISTQGVRQTGRAVLSEFNAEAILTIEGGNDPHGVFSFALNSLRRYVEEADTVISLSIDRKFGAIGKFPDRRFFLPDWPLSSLSLMFVIMYLGHLVYVTHTGMLMRTSRPSLNSCL